MVADTLNSADYTTASDGMLIDFTLKGDHQAFELLVKRHQSQLYRSMMHVARSADVAEELVQDALVQAYVKLSSFKGNSAFSSWLFRIAFNKYLGMKRSRPSPTSLNALEEAAQFQPVDPRESPEQSVSRVEDRQRVLRALNRLDPKVRRILELREMQGLTYDEIGEALNLKPGTVRSQLSRARWKLHHELANPTSSSTFAASC